MPGPLELVRESPHYEPVEPLQSVRTHEALLCPLCRRGRCWGVVAISPGCRATRLRPVQEQLRRDRDARVARLLRKAVRLRAVTAPRSAEGLTGQLQERTTGSPAACSRTSDP